MSEAASTTPHRSSRLQVLALLQLVEAVMLQALGVVQQQQQQQRRQVVAVHGAMPRQASLLLLWPARLCMAAAAAAAAAAAPLAVVLIQSQAVACRIQLMVAGWQIGLAQPAAAAAVVAAAAVCHHQQQQQLALANSKADLIDALLFQSFRFHVLLLVCIICNVFHVVLLGEVKQTVVKLWSKFRRSVQHHGTPMRCTVRHWFLMTFNQ
jgi:hypothetical protein